MKTLLLAFLMVNIVSLEAMVRTSAKNEALSKANEYYAANNWLSALGYYKQALTQVEQKSEDYYTILGTMMSIYHTGSDATAVKPDIAFEYAKILKEQTIDLPLRDRAYAVLAQSYFAGKVIPADTEMALFYAKKAQESDARWAHEQGSRLIEKIEKLGRSEPVKKEKSSKKSHSHHSRSNPSASLTLSAAAAASPSKDLCEWFRSEEHKGQTTGHTADKEKKSKKSHSHHSRSNPAASHTNPTLAAAAVAMMAKRPTYHVLALPELGLELSRAIGANDVQKTADLLFAIAMKPASQLATEDMAKKKEEIFRKCCQAAIQRGNVNMVNIFMMHAERLFKGEADKGFIEFVEYLYKTCSQLDTCTIILIKELIVSQLDSTHSELYKDIALRKVFDVPSTCNFNTPKALINYIVDKGYSRSLPSYKQSNLYNNYLELLRYLLNSRIGEASNDFLYHLAQENCPVVLECAVRCPHLDVNVSGCPLGILEMAAFKSHWQCAQILVNAGAKITPEAKESFRYNRHKPLKKNANIQKDAAITPESSFILYISAFLSHPEYSSLIPESMRNSGNSASGPAIVASIVRAIKEACYPAYISPFQSNPDYSFLQPSGINDLKPAATALAPTVAAGASAQPQATTHAQAAPHHAAAAARHHHRGQNANYVLGEALIKESPAIMNSAANLFSTMDQGGFSF